MRTDYSQLTPEAAQALIKSLERHLARYQLMIDAWEAQAQMAAKSRGNRVWDPPARMNATISEMTKLEEKIQRLKSVGARSTSDVERREAQFSRYIQLLEDKLCKSYQRIEELGAQVQQ